MGSYATLHLGPVDLSWKGYLPAYLALVFDESELVIQHEKSDSDPDESIVSVLEIRTTGGIARERLDAAGYTLEFLADVYMRFRSSARRVYEDELEAERWSSNLEGRAEDEAKMPDTSLLDQARPATELNAYVEYQRTQLQGAQNSTSSDELRSRMRIIELDPVVALVACVFDDRHSLDYPDVIGLLELRLIVEALDAEEAVVLNLHDLYNGGYLPDEERQLRGLLDKLRAELAEKVLIYDKVFESLSRRDDVIRRRLANAKARALLDALPNARTADEKGRALEMVLDAVITGDEQLQIVERRYSTGDEEIDLLVKNNVERPFWLALNSPLIFFECKNWSGSVGSKEVRAFEGNLLNHAAICRVGVLVAANGYSSEAFDQVKRASRDRVLVLITLADLESAFRSGAPVATWLEEQIARVR